MSLRRCTLVCACLSRSLRQTPAGGALGERIIGVFSTGRPPDETRIAETLIRDRVDIRAATAELADPVASLESLARETVLILQGGRALGAFECGVVRAMEEAKIAAKIVGGVSVGAITVRSSQGIQRIRPAHSTPSGTQV